MSAAERIMAAAYSSEPESNTVYSLFALQVHNSHRRSACTSRVVTSVLTTNLGIPMKMMISVIIEL